MKIIPVSELIAEQEYEITKNKFLTSILPDISKKELQGTITYSSVMLKKTYQTLIISKYTSFLEFERYSEFTFEYNGKKEIIKVNAIPYTEKVAFHYSNIHYKNLNIPNLPEGQGEFIYFKKLTPKLRPEFYTLYASNIAEFVKKFPKSYVCTDNLDKRLKKLLTFL